MGLNLYVKGYSPEKSKIGSYIGFGIFRKVWAKHLGFDLNEMEGFGGDKKWTNEPIQSFFNHSDCEGEIKVEDCRKILKQALRDKDEFQGYEYEFEILIRFLEEAIKRNKPLEFA